MVAARRSRSTAEAFLARLTTTAYQVALRHGIKGSFAELELDLWHELRAVCDEDESETEGDRPMAAVNRRVLPGFSLSLGYAVFYLSVLVLIPLAACFLKAASLSLVGVLGAVWTDRARAAYALTFGCAARRGRGQRGPRPARRLDAGALRLPAQAARRRPGRSAVRPADGRGRAGLRDPVRAERLARAVPGAARHRGGVLAARDRAGAGVHRLPVRRADGAAGAGSARRRDRGGGADPRGAAAGRRSAACSCRRCCRPW